MAQTEGHENNREFIDGSAVITRQTAMMIHPPTGKLVEYRDVDEVLLEDGRTVYQCNSRYKSQDCMMFHEDSRSILPHLKVHVPAEYRKGGDKAKYKPNPDRVVRKPIVDTEPAPTITPGEAALVVLNFSGAAEADAEQAERDEDAAKLRRARLSELESDLKADEHDTDAGDGDGDGEVLTTRQLAARRAWATRRANGTTGVGDEQVANHDPRQLAGMKVAGLQGTIAALCSSVHQVEVAAVKLQNELMELHDKVGKIDLTDPEIVEKARKYDSIKGLLE